MTIRMEYVLDSFAWLEYFAGNPKFLAYVDGGGHALPITPATALTEVIRSLLRKKIDQKDIDSFVKFMIGRSIVLSVEREGAIRAGFLAEETGLHFSDALIYSFSDSQRIIVTGDPHFRGLKNVEFVA